MVIKQKDLKKKLFQKLKISDVLFHNQEEVFEIDSRN